MVVKESTASIAAPEAFTMKFCKCIDFAAKTAGESESGRTCFGYFSDMTQTEQILFLLHHPW